ncbi:MAG: TonB-dependent receptor [Chitinophagaceae bacterium]|nr:TonB-dependent receptor [Chitinophagaceae bacterium]
MKLLVPAKGASRVRHGNISLLYKTLLYMKLTAILLISACLQVHANSYAQKITINVKQASLQKVFKEIKKQTEYLFFYSDDVMKESIPVTLALRDATVEEVLDECFKMQPLTYAIVKNSVVIKFKRFALPEENIVAETAAPPPIDVKGKITDENGNALDGATIRIKGKNKAVQTSINGEYIISDIEENDVLIISFIGFQTQEIAVKGRNDVSIVLKIASTVLDSTVVVGYGNKKKRLFNGAVTSVKSSEIDNIPASNLTNLLAGRMSGVYVSQSTGTPGVASGIRVRSTASWNANEPLYVIDGVVRNKAAFDALDPNEVEEVSVLKDAGSAAIYGVRSTNGVIMATTKRGSAQKAVITYNGSVSYEKPTRINKLMDVNKAIQVFNEAYPEDIPSLRFGPDEVAYFKENGGYNWLDYVYRDPLTHRHALSISGGTDRIKYYIGGSYYNEIGFLDQLKYNKYNLRGNIEARLHRDITVSLGLGNMYDNRERYNFSYDGGSADLNNLWYKLLYFHWNTPPYIDGKPVNPGWLGNSIEMIKNGGYTRQSTQRMDALMTLNYNVHAVPGLSARVSFSKNLTNDYTKEFGKRTNLYNFKPTGSSGKIMSDTLIGTSVSGDPGREYLSNYWQKINESQFNAQASYVKSIGDHNINATVVYEQYTQQYNNLYGARYNFPIILTDQFFATSDNPSDASIGGDELETARLSYIGRLDYDYKQKYILTASVRRDGSTLFAPNKRWGWFPSVLAGWVISEESFFKSKAIDFLKVRASFGMTGSDAVGGWQWQERYVASGGFYFGDRQVKGIQHGGIVNPNLTWEKSKSYNFGANISFLNNFTFSADYWFRNTYNILGARIQSVPVSFGGSMPSENYGKVDSKGYELELGYNAAITRSLNFFVKGNFSWAANKIKLQDVGQNVRPENNPIGRPLGTISGYLADDILRTQADVDKLPDNYRIIGFVPEIGMLNYVDVSGPNQVPDGTIDGYDQRIIYNYSTPPISYGLLLRGEWKGLSLEVFFQGLAGHKKYYNDGYGRKALIGTLLPHSIWNDHWTPENPDAKMPKPRPDWMNFDNVASSFWLYDASFIRLKNMQLGYNFPVKFIKRAGLRDLKLIASATNLFFISKFKFYDPEVSSAMSYPNMKVFTFGVNVSL